MGCCHMYGCGHKCGGLGSHSMGCGHMYGCGHKCGGLGSHSMGYGHVYGCGHKCGEPQVVTCMGVVTSVGSHSVGCGHKYLLMCSHCPNMLILLPIIPFYLLSHVMSLMCMYSLTLLIEMTYGWQDMYLSPYKS